MMARHRIPPAILARAREMRHPQTVAETTLWHALRTQQTGFKFRRQHPIDRFIVDFYCAKAKLLIEVDGEFHLEPEQEEYDKVRTEYLEELGYKVIRFSNNDVRHNIDTVANQILQTVENRIAELKSKNFIFPHPNPLPSGERGKD